MSCATIIDNDSTLVTPATFAQEFPCAFRASNHDAAANAKIRFNPDGTWQTARVPVDVAQSGSWHIGAPSNPADFEIRITGNVRTVTTTSGTMDCATPPYQETNTPIDTGWLSLAVAQEQLAIAYATANVNCTEQSTNTVLTFTATIRQISRPANAVSDSGSVCAEADAMTN